MKKVSDKSLLFLNGSMLLYIVWLLLPALQKTGHAVTGCIAVGLFGVGILLDTEWLKKHWTGILGRAACAAAMPLLLRVFLQRGGTHVQGFYIQQAMFWFPLIFAGYARERGDSRLWRYTRIALIGAVSITVLTTIGWLTEGMLRGGKIYAYSRSLGYAGEGSEAYLAELMYKNIGGYDFVYAMVASLPLTSLGIIRSRERSRLFFSVLLVLQTVMIVMSQYTYAMLYAAAILFAEGVGALLRRISRGKLSAGVSILLGLSPILILIMLAIPLLNLAVSVCSGLGLTGFANSFSLLLGSLQNNAAEEGSRLSYYLIALKGFTASPLTGSMFGGETLLSGHSDILDLLSGMGLLGTILVSGMIAVMGRKALRGLRDHPDRSHLILTGAAFFVTALLGTVIYSRDIMLIAALGTLLVLEGQTDHASGERGAGL